jgi:hypothetical protein
LACLKGCNGKNGKGDDSSGPEGQGRPLTLRGDPNGYKRISAFGSNLSTVWLHPLHLWKQTLSTHYEENISKTNSFVCILSLDPCRIVFDDQGLSFYMKEVFCFGTPF